ncbi:hypothetical protein O9992_19935 [Vibrio lentus]|nr:hypothetical protein [Vibrio lentus]
MHQSVCFPVVTRCSGGVRGCRADCCIGMVVGPTPAKLALIGIAVSAFLASCIDFLLVLFDRDQHGHGVANWQPLGTKLAASSLLLRLYCSCCYPWHYGLAIRCYGAWLEKVRPVDCQAKTNS